jgi:uncharacterized Zn-finger protein
MTDKAELKTADVLILVCVLYCPECGNAFESRAGEVKLIGLNVRRLRKETKCPHCKKKFALPEWLKGACR